MATQRPTSAGAALADRQVNFGKAHVRYFSKDSPCNPPAHTSSSEATPTAAKERPCHIVRRTSSAESLLNPILRHTSSARPPARDTAPAHSQSARSVRELQRASPVTGTRASAHSATRLPLRASDSQLSLASTECGGSPGELVRASKVSARHQSKAARDSDDESKSPDSDPYLELDTLPRSGSFESLDALDLGVSPEASPRDRDAVAKRRAGMMRQWSATF